MRTGIISTTVFESGTSKPFLNGRIKNGSATSMRPVIPEEYIDRQQLTAIEKSPPFTGKIVIFHCPFLSVHHGAQELHIALVVKSVW